MRHRTSVALRTIVAIVALVVLSDGYSQTASPRVLANTCFSCHGTGGKSRGAMPTIAGKSARYIVQSLRDFRADKRPATVMNRIAKGFTDDEIEALGRYFSGQ